MKEHQISPEKLNELPKEAVVLMYTQLMGSFELLSEQNRQLLEKVDTLTEQIQVLTQSRFGRKSEKLTQVEGQLSLQLDGLCILNEAEKLTEAGFCEEPEMETVVIRRKRPKGKRQADLKDIETVIDEHTLSEERLSELFPNGYRRLPDEVYRDLEYIPAKFLVHEHHVAVYAGKKDEGIVRADRPERLLKNSILTPALAAAVFNAKYVNAVSLNRLSEEFLRNDIDISRQNMAGWMIKISERYLGNVYRAMKKELLKSRLIHCDETPFKLVDERGPNSKSYMWVYHTYERYGSVPVYLYEYRPTRSTQALREFLAGYKGILLTDGYEAYHKLEKERCDELTVAGCWAHARRKFAELVKAGTASSKTAEEAVKRIGAIYHVDNMYKEKSEDERLENRKQSVKPLVDSFFEWIEELMKKPMDKGGKLYGAVSYAHNQESYLRRFLDNGIIPLDNNDAERSIRSFCVGKKNWHIADSKNGATASGILYSIAETAKANKLKPYEYFKYLLEQILLHVEDPPEEYMDDLLPWSEKLPDYCRNLRK